MHFSSSSSPYTIHRESSSSLAVSDTRSTGKSSWDKIVRNSHATTRVKEDSTIGKHLFIILSAMRAYKYNLSITTILLSARRRINVTMIIWSFVCVLNLIIIEIISMCLHFIPQHEKSITRMLMHIWCSILIVRMLM